MLTLGIGLREEIANDGHFWQKQPFFSTSTPDQFSLCKERRRVAGNPWGWEGEWENDEWRHRTNKKVNAKRSKNEGETLKVKSIWNKKINKTIPAFDLPSLSEKVEGGNDAERGLERNYSRR